MCSYFLERMENYQGDLADIIRASGGSVGGTTADVSTDWQFQSDHMNFHDPSDDFGHPFSDLRDPLLHELDVSDSGFYNTSNCSTEMVIKTSVEHTGGFGGGISGGIVDEEMKIMRPCNIFSRILQISPNAKLPVSPTDSPMVASSPRGLKASTLVSNDVIISANCFKGGLAENAAVQISSPRNTGIKRRKGQAKKVMCIPAPAPANSRPTGEIVPSDLWAWRKYGQKPIKGSPYPRGYYRCSSSKGCSARKQVERSRTDPNMLVITYTSEHNHPWPTQRNALAGSTRTQPSKNNSSSSKNSPKIMKEEEKEIINTDINVSSSNVTTTGPPVKEEMEELDKQMDMDDDEFGGQGVHQSYRPALPDSNRGEDFFADLGELEADPLSLLFTQGFSGDEERESDKSLDPFSFYDWTGSENNSSSSSSNNNNSTSLGEQAKRGS